MYLKVYTHIHTHTSMYQKNTDKTRACLMAQMVKIPPAMQETQVQLLGQEDPLEKGMIYI